MTDKPNPGSDAAIRQGCTCPVLDNDHGRGSGPFWMSIDCQLHGGSYFEDRCDSFFELENDIPDGVGN